MKHLSIFLLIYLLFPVAKAQKDDLAQTYLNKRCKHLYLSLSPERMNSNQKAAFPFRKIEVVDYRADSSRIGLFVMAGQQHDLRFRFPAHSAISTFLNEDYSNSLASKTLFVVIKKLWFSDVPKKHNVPLFFLFPAAYAYGSFAIDEKVIRKLRFFALDMGTGEIF